MPFSTAMQRPTITSSLTFSMMAAASPATSASNTGARYRFQNRNSSPAMCPDTTKTMSAGVGLTSAHCGGANVAKQVGVWIPKHPVKTQHHLHGSPGLPKPSLVMASAFHCGSGGLKETVFGALGLVPMDCFRTPRGSVHNTASAAMEGHIGHNNIWKLALYAVKFM
ncbi:hypothetical protein E2C01_009556 [Portunus trituberculatus]|uniref:Uncharacterized protein n=1 Tax=Portunus trituberculatus TaxID=210409 RepID=A0A5B7D647_PORTR|nr:hypothetical protein [Portunus trituberculatus]